MRALPAFACNGARLSGRSRRTNGLETTNERSSCCNHAIGRDCILASRSQPCQICGTVTTSSWFLVLLTCPIETVTCGGTQGPHIVSEWHPSSASLHQSASTVNIIRNIFVILFLRSTRCDFSHSDVHVQTISTTLRRSRPWSIHQVAHLRCLSLPMKA